MSATAPSSRVTKATDVDQIVVFDFGSQTAQLIARRVREQRVYCEILRHDVSAERIRQRMPRGIILSGGPNSVYDEGAPKCDPAIFQLGIPVLGICYGMQLICEAMGGKVQSVEAREFGRASCAVLRTDDFLKGLPEQIDVWMSHGDQVIEVSGDFEALARTESCPVAAVRHGTLPLYGLQFHPEVTHTPLGPQILDNFVRAVCGCGGDWTMSNFAQREIEEIRQRVGSARVICGLSGGVDSAVTAALLSSAIGDQLSCILVDNGLLRKDEAEAVIGQFSDHFKTDLHVVPASEQFLQQLAGVVDPQEKRRRIGHAFIECFEKEAEKITDAKFLAQGTLYPDVIESGAAVDGPAATIKFTPPTSVVFLRTSASN